MPSIGVGKSPRKIAAAKAKAEKIFNDSANTRAAEIGVTLPANFQELSNNQSQKSSGISKYTGADYVNLYTSNKTAFLENSVKNATYDYAWLSYGRTTSPADAELRLKNAVTAAAQNGVPIPSIYSSVEAGKNDWGSYIGSRETNIDRIAGYAAPIAMAYFMPQVGASLGTALLQAGVVTTTATASAVGTALTSIAIQTAQGASFDDALKNATVNAIISTGAPSVATEINDIVGNRAVSNAIVSAGASALKTVAAGGSTEDMQKNILGAIAGSATTSATGDNIVGSTVGGAVTGGVAGALSGAASALGQEEATKPRDTTTQQLVTAIQKEQANPSPSTELGKVAGITSDVPGYVTTDASGNTVLDLLAGGVTDDGVSPTVYVTGTQGGTPTLGETKQDVIETITAPKTPVASNIRPDGTAKGNGYLGVLKASDGSDVTEYSMSTGDVTLNGKEIDFPSIVPTLTKQEVNLMLTDIIPNNKPIPDAIVNKAIDHANKRIQEGKSVFADTEDYKPVATTTPTEPAKPPVTPSVTPESVVPTTPAPPSGFPVVSEQDQRMLDLISPPPAPTTEPDQTLPEVVVTATPDKETTPLVTDTKTETKEPPPVDAGEEELPPEEVETEATTPTDKYKPKLFIYGGTTPSTLSQSLGTGDTYSKSVATTGLTGSRGAGEIESKETGKKRRTVWNEESLRLKDALGL